MSVERKDMFRTLYPDEIEVRVQSFIPKSKGAILLLYKDARCDMIILDETVGAFNWERKHTRDNANCIVSIYNEETNQWVSKEDTGTESMTEKAKGLASDSFKRACFNWGIGRELYTSPFIWVNIEDKEVSNGKISSRLKFSVKEITYTKERKIDRLVIVDNNNKVRYTQRGIGKVERVKEVAEEKPANIIKATQDQVAQIKMIYQPEELAEKVLPYYKVKEVKDLSLEQASQAISHRKNK